MAKILLVEDNLDLSQMVKRWLDHDRHMVDVAYTGKEAMAFLSATEHDLMILDWELPAPSGIEICKHFRSKGGLAPVLFITGRQSIDDKEVGFSVGADDYLTKPFHIKELLMRVQALLRRRPTEAQGPLTCSGLLLDRAGHSASRDGKSLQLSKKEFELLKFFMRHPNQVFSTDELIARLWASDTEATSGTIRAAIKQLRKKIGDEEGVLIENVFKVGYRLTAQ